MDQSNEKYHSGRMIAASVLSRSTMSIGKADFPLEQLPQILRQYSPLVFLNSNLQSQEEKDKYAAEEVIMAAGEIEVLDSAPSLFISLRQLHDNSNDWIFGALTYDVKNQCESLTSFNADSLNFPDSYFFIPRFVIRVSSGNIEVSYPPALVNQKELMSLIESIRNGVTHSETNNDTEIKEIRSRISREEFIENVVRIKQHIQRGDIYEMNYCQEFFAEDVTIDPAAVYMKLNELSPMPFSAYMKVKHHHVICGSPERFLAKRGKKLISQPIKGTARRSGKDDAAERDKLKADPKERSENVMIVDLVRNDLSRTANRDSVKVEELFGVKSFPRLHHLISTVTSELSEEFHFTDALRTCFPMGSMTGAPKIRAMELIEKFESAKRGIYSGSVGYISPSGDFDFNVVIRSIVYNESNHYLSFMTGSAITINSSPEKEYDECLLKAEAITKALSGN